MRRAVILALLLFLPGCVNKPDYITRLDPATPGWKMLPGRLSLPEGSHKPTNCGPETLCAALNFLGIPATISEVERDTYIPSIKGSVPPRIVDYARRKGATAKVTERGGLWKLQAHIEAGSPVIIEVTRGGMYHYYFVAGISKDERAIVCVDYGDQQQRLSFELLDELWRPTQYRSITFSVTPIDDLLQQGFDYLEHGRYELAEERFLKALQLQAECGPAFAGLGRIRIYQQRLPEALDYLERAYKLLPTDPEVLNDLAHATLELKGDAERAASLAKEAVRLKLRQIRDLEEELAAAPPESRKRVEEDLQKARENIFYLYGTLGQALEANGKAKESIDARLASLKFPHLEEDDPDAPARRHLEIGLTYKAMGDKAKAADHIKLALSLAKSEDMKKRIRD
jgi:hypothetical protein